MPQVIGFYIAVTLANIGVSGSVALAIGDTLGTIAITTGASLALTGIEAALAPGPPDPAAVAQPLKQATPSRVSAYGRVRMSGAYALFDINANGDAVDVLMVHDGQIDGWERFYLNDDRITLNGTGWVQALSRSDGRYSAFDKVQLLTRLGLPSETYYDTLVTAPLPGWDSTHRGDGIATIALGCRTPKEKYYPTIYPNGDPQVSAVLRALRVLDWRTATTAWSQNPVLALADYLTSADHGMGMDYAARIAPALDVWTAAANDCDSLMPVLHLSGNTAGDAAAGATTLTLDGVAGIANGVAVQLGADVTNVETITATGVSGSTVSFASPGLAYAHKAGEYVNWVAPSSAPAMLPRYQLGGAYKHTDAPSDVVSAMLASFDGWLGQRGDGALVVYSGRYYAPTVTLGSDAIVGHQIAFGIEDENATNVLVVNYSDPAHDYATVEGQPWRDDDDIAARGLEKSDQLALTWVQRHDQARRLAKRQMSRNTAPWRGPITCNLAGMAALGERFIQAQVDDYGIDSPAEVLHGEIDLMNLQVTFTVIPADPNGDAWDPVLEEGSPPPWQGRAVTVVATPVISVVTAVFADTGTGAGSGVKLQVKLVDPGRSDLTFGVRWRVSGDTSWTELSFSDWTASGGFVILTTGIVPANVTLEVEAEAVAGDGTNTPWSTPAVTVSTSTAGLAPAAPTAFAAANGTGKVTLSWRNPSSPNLDHLVLYESTGSAFASATIISNPVPGGGALGASDSYVRTVSAGTRNYWIAAFNASGASSVAGPIVGVSS